MRVVGEDPLESWPVHALRDRTATTARTAVEDSADARKPICRAVFSFYIPAFFGIMLYASFYLGREGSILSYVAYASIASLIAMLFNVLSSWRGQPFVSVTTPKDAA